jgi:ubiquinone/menaquinone biosynthesis C-methylase UbiE
MIAEQQKLAFLAGEGDAWIDRNLPKLDQPAWWIVAERDQFAYGDHVLEIGCGNGRNVRWLQDTCSCFAFGIDPAAHSPYAIGTADDLGLFPDNCFDTVVHGFELYLVDRELMPAVVAETDRVLKRDGTLIIHDFSGVDRYVVPYKHKDGLFSYHDDYSTYWRMKGYRLVMAITTRDETTWILHKKN